MAPNDAAAAVCVECGSALGETSFFGPTYVIRPEGPVRTGKNVYWVSDEITGLQVLGLWVLILPAMVGVAIWVIYNLRRGLDGNGFIFLLLGLGLEFLGFATLRKFTRVYRDRNQNPRQSKKN